MTLDPKTLEHVARMFDEGAEDCDGDWSARARRNIAARVRAMAPKVEGATRTAEQERADERERIALAFDEAAENPEMRAHAKCLRASAAFVRALVAKGGA